METELKIGDKVIFTGTHPWAGHTGTYLRHERMSVMLPHLQPERARFSVDESGGRETFASPKNYRRISGGHAA